MKKKNLLIALALTLSFGGAQAKSIDESTALSVARSFFQQSQIRLTATNSSNSKLSLATANSAYYVFNRGSNGGFVIVAADDVAHPVLGYTDRGHFDATAVPANMRAWLSGYERAITAASAAHATASTEASTTVERSAVEPLLTTKWGTLYNNTDLYTPTIDGEQCRSSALSIALAQIMHYYKWPAQGKGSVSYRWKNVGDTLTCDFSEHTYDWDAMLDVYSFESSAAANEAVSRLVADVGYAAQTNYGRSFSTNYNVYLGIWAMYDHFDYDKSLIFYDRSRFGRAEWEQMCYDEVAAGRPIYYVASYDYGNDGECDHSFVCDGYRDGYFHMNWGLNGVYDGYYILSAIDQPEGDTRYDIMQAALFYLRPPQEGSTYTTYMLLSGDFSASTSEATHASSVKFGGQFVNAGLVSITVYPGIKVTDAAGNTTYIASTTPKTRGRMTYFGSYEVSLADFPTADGLYTVTPAYYDAETGTWGDFRSYHSDPRACLKARVSGDNITFLPQTDERHLRVADFTVLNKAYVGKELRVSVTLTADSSDYQGTTAIILEPDDPTLESKIGYREIDLMKGETQTYKLSVTVPDTVTSYTLRFEDTLDSVLYGPIKIMSEAVPTDPVAFRLTAAPVVANADNVDTDNFNLTANVECTAGYYEGMIPLFVYPEGGSFEYSVAIAYKYNVTLGAGETQTLTFSEALKPYGDVGFEVGKRYTALLLYPSEDGAFCPITTADGDGAVTFTVGKTATGIATATTSPAQATLIYNAAGVLVGRQSAATVDTSHLPAGLYIVREGGVARKIIVR